MSGNFLEFEQPIVELEAKIEELRLMGDDNELNISDEIRRLEQKRKELSQHVFSSLTPWQISELARHPQRPHTLDYLGRIFTDFDELHGDRQLGDETAIVAGLARLNDQSVAVIGHQKGRTTKENIDRNFGMSKPEGYRKALRIMQLAAKFRLPVITFIDTAGAYPGIEAEEHGQSQAIANNLFQMIQLPIPMIGVVIGEGGSGGALAIGMTDRILMLQYSIYSVISPEGCASILWKSADKKREASEALQITADRLSRLGLVDQVIREPLGGAHRDVDAISDSVKEALITHLEELKMKDIHEMVAERYQRFMSFGQ